jgi:hypothetical protein
MAGWPGIATPFPGSSWGSHRAVQRVFFKDEIQSDARVYSDVLNVGGG